LRSPASAASQKNGFATGNMDLINSQFDKLYNKKGALNLFTEDIRDKHTKITIIYRDN